MRSYLYVAPGLDTVGRFASSELEEFTERHHFRMPILALAPVRSIEQGIAEPTTSGVVLGMSAGLPGRRQLRLARRALRHRRSVYFNWPAENAIEVVDDERLRSFWRHWLAYAAAVGAQRIRARWRRRREAVAESGASLSVAADLRTALSPIAGAIEALGADYGSTKAHILGGLIELRRIAHELADMAADFDEDQGRAPIDRAARCDIEKVRAKVDALARHFGDGEIALDRATDLIAGLAQQVTTAMGEPAAVPTLVIDAAADSVIGRYRHTLESLTRRLQPVAFTCTARPPTAAEKMPGTGVYLRTDFWAQLVSGGSYGHTCYVAQELAATTEDFVCLLGSRFPLLDELSLSQEIVRPPIGTMNEIDLLAADAYYYDELRPRLEAIRPAYIYERAVLGNFAAARLSRDLNIPYIVEYNGSEIAMRHSFGSGSFDHEALFLEAERLMFQQATAITVISEHVRADVIARGVDPDKVFTNPNGVDCDEYNPASAAEKSEIRASLGLPDAARVIGFIGTFGGWHGIDVLAAALPEICRRDETIRFLLIGDGNLKPQIIETIAKHGLQRQVVDVGRTDQRGGARLLKAADIYVSPHSSHMRDTPFFGSPTKLFEYMAMAGGIVASDLEQLGEVLRPALRCADLARGSLHVSDERAVLCRPGDVDEFVAGVLALVKHPEVASALGRNARAAALRHFSWRSHVARLWDHIFGLGADASWHPSLAGRA